MPYLLTNPSISQWTLGNVIRARNILLLLLNNFLKKNNTAFHLSNKTTWVLCEVAASMSLRSVVMLEKLKIPWRLKVSFCTNDYRGIRTLYADANKARFPFKRNRLPTQALAFLAVFVYATHATQPIAFEWKPGLTLVEPGTLKSTSNQTETATKWSKTSKYNRWWRWWWWYW